MTPSFLWDSYGTHLHLTVMFTMLRIPYFLICQPHIFGQLLEVAQISDTNLLIVVLPSHTIHELRD